MKTTLNILRVTLSAVAAFIISSSRLAWAADHQDKHASAVAWATLTFLSVVFLHWLVLRYLVIDGLQASPAPEQLRLAADRGYARSFFGGITGVGYLFVFLYACEIFTGAGLIQDGTTMVVPTGNLLLGVVFLFLGLVARARGIIVSLHEGRTVPTPIA